MYPRALDLREWIRHRSLFLFGPRQTGKSTLLRSLFPAAAFYDLLEADTFRSSRRARSICARPCPQGRSS